MFKIGEDVVCTAEGWIWVLSGEPGDGPKKDQIYQVQRISVVRGEVFLHFAEYDGHGFGAAYFRKFYDETVYRIIRQVTKKPIRLR